MRLTPATRLQCLCASLRYYCTSHAGLSCQLLNAALAGMQILVARHRLRQASSCTCGTCWRHMHHMLSRVPTGRRSLFLRTHRRSVCATVGSATACSATRGPRPFCAETRARSLIGQGSRPMSPELVRVCPSAAAMTERSLNPRRGAVAIGGGRPTQNYLTLRAHYWRHHGTGGTVVCYSGQENRPEPEPLTQACAADRRTPAPPPHSRLPVERMMF